MHISSHGRSISPLLDDVSPVERQENDDHDQTRDEGEPAVAQRRACGTKGNKHQRLTGPLVSKRSSYIKRFYPKRFTVLADIHPFIHSFMHTSTHRRRSQPCRETASWSGAVRVRRLAQGHSARRSRGSHQQPCGYQPTRSTS